MTEMGKKIGGWAKKLRDDANKPSYINTASYKNKRNKHEAARGPSKKEKIARKMEIKNDYMGHRFDHE